METLSKVYMTLPPDEVGLAIAIVHESDIVDVLSSVIPVVGHTAETIVEKLELVRAAILVGNITTATKLGTGNGPATP